jgi:hypothetical protein
MACARGEYMLTNNVVKFNFKLLLMSSLLCLNLFAPIKKKKKVDKQKCKIHKYYQSNPQSQSNIPIAPTQNQSSNQRLQPYAPIQNRPDVVIQVYVPNNRSLRDYCPNKENVVPAALGLGGASCIVAFLLFIVYSSLNAVTQNA